MSAAFSRLDPTTFGNLGCAYGTVITVRMDRFDCLGFHCVVKKNAFPRAQGVQRCGLDAVLFGTWKLVLLEDWAIFCGSHYIDFLPPYCGTGLCTSLSLQVI